ncbi:MAG: hypothetical protein HQK91_03255 [Nitrospirae bacterium]|nr:hypothetical protein [Nitrospirota bacterium]
MDNENSVKVGATPITAEEIQLKREEVAELTFDIKSRMFICTSTKQQIGEILLKIKGTCKGRDGLFTAYLEAEFPNSIRFAQYCIQSNKRQETINANIAFWATGKEPEELKAIVEILLSENTSKKVFNEAIKRLKECGFLSIKEIEAIKNEISAEKTAKKSKELSQPSAQMENINAEITQLVQIERIPISTEEDITKKSDEPEDSAETPKEIPINNINSETPEIKQSMPQETMNPPIMGNFNELGEMPIEPPVQIAASIKVAGLDILNGQELRTYYNIGIKHLSNGIEEITKGLEKIEKVFEKIGDIDDIEYITSEIRSKIASSQQLVKDLEAALELSLRKRAA